MNTCIALYADGDNITYFDSFGVWKIHKQTKISKQTFTEYKKMILYFVDIFVLDLLILC